jgi:small subunit ribosomal protein S5
MTTKTDTKEQKTTSAPPARPSTGGQQRPGGPRGDFRQRRPAGGGGARQGGQPGAGGAGRGGFQGKDSGNDRRPRRKPSRERVRSEFDQKIINIRRVTRVVAGGRRFSFSVALVAGNGKGSVGVGIGKASDTALAIEKAFRDAKKNMTKINLTKNGSIAYDVEAKYCASRVVLRPAPGKGIMAGSSARNVLELGGIKDVSGKVLSRSKNKLNNAQATVEALKKLSA